MVIVGPLADADRAPARTGHLTLEPLSLQELVVHAAGRPARRRAAEDHRMKTWINVARYHLVNRVSYLVLPWTWLAFAVAVDLVIFALIPISHHSVVTAHGIVQVQDDSGRDAGGLGAIVAIFFAMGVQSVARSLPFALALGVSRRSYYTGTALLAVTLAVGYGLVLTAAAGHRAGHGRVGSGHAHLPGAVHPRRAVVPDLADDRPWCWP